MTLFDLHSCDSDWQTWLQSLVYSLTLITCLAYPKLPMWIVVTNTTVWYYALSLYCWCCACGSVITRCPSHLSTNCLAYLLIQTVNHSSGVCVKLCFLWVAAITVWLCGFDRGEGWQESWGFLIVHKLYFNDFINNVWLLYWLINT